MIPCEKAYELRSKSKIIIQKYVTRHILEFKGKKKFLKTVWEQRQITYKAVRIRGR